MAVLRAQITLPRDTALPEDAVVNHLHFETFTSPPTEPEQLAVFDAIEAFYSSFDQFLSPNLASPVLVALYNLADPEPRVPIAEASIALTYSTSDPFPSQVACVMSFQAQAQSGVNQARRRNRIFIGPVAGNAQVVVDGIGRPSDGFRAAVQTGAESLLSEVFTANGIRWVVRSETAGTIAEVDNGWVDNSWDTQRRRLERPTLRTTFERA